MASQRVLNNQIHKILKRAINCKHLKRYFEKRIYQLTEPKLLAPLLSFSVFYFRQGREEKVSKPDSIKRFLNKAGSSKCWGWEHIHPVPGPLHYLLSLCSITGFKGKRVIGCISQNWVTVWKQTGAFHISHGRPQNTCSIPSHPDGGFHARTHPMEPLRYGSWNIPSHLETTDLGTTCLSLLLLHEVFWLSRTY